MTTRSTGGWRTSTGYEAGAGHPAIPYAYLSGCNLYEKTSADTPDFHRLQREGALLPLNFYQSYRVDSFYGSGSWSLVSPGGSTYEGNTLPATGFIGSADVSVGLVEITQQLTQWDPDPHIEAAISNLYAQSWDGLTFAAELKSTVAMFKGALGKLIQILRKIDLRKIEDAWLEWRYGWRTLWYDMQDIQKALEGLAEPKSGVYSARSGVKVKHATESSRTLGNSAWSAVWRKHSNYEISVRGTCASKIAPPRIVINPLITAWELVTFSFIIDWFLTVGNTLSALSGRLWHADLHTAGGYRVEVNTICYLEQFKALNGWSGYMHAGTSCTESVLLRIPMVPDYLPNFTFRVDVAKVFDLLAILHQLLRRR